MLSCHEVRHLLMGGQACVFYGAAEFSRDCDIVVVADNENLMRLIRHLQSFRRNASLSLLTKHSTSSEVTLFIFAVTTRMRWVCVWMS
jgi:hypothetical protein